MLVKLQVVGGRSNTCNVRFAIAGEVADDAIRAGDGPIQYGALPALAVRVGRLMDREPGPFAAEPTDDLVATIAVEVPHGQGMAVLHLVVEHEPLPRRVLGKIDHQLVPVPRLDGSQETARAQMAQAHLAAAAQGPGPRIAWGDRRGDPLAPGELDARSTSGTAKEMLQDISLDCHEQYDGSAIRMVSPELPRVNFLPESPSPDPARQGEQGLGVWSWHAARG